MSKIALAISIAIGLVPVIVVYLAFLAHEFVKGGQSNVTVGVGVLFCVANPGHNESMKRAGCATVYF